MPTPKRRAGFTLLEVLLAAALTAVLMGSLCWAIDMYVRLVDAGRSRVAQMQLARAVLNRIAEDLRGAVYPEPVDVSSIQALMAGAGQRGQSAAQQGGGQNQNQTPTPPGGPTDEDDSGDQDQSGQPQQQTDQSTETEQQPVTTESNPAAVPGVYGDEDILQIDVSRLPRMDEYYGTLDQMTGTLKSPHDVRTVTYFLGSGTSANGQAVSGLVRREVNRAVGLYNGTSGGTPTGADDQLLAPEVIALELHYFDGTEWLTTWDTSVNKGLPLAVEIAIEVQAEQRGADASNLSSWLSAAAEEQQTEIYRLIVNLPAAKPSESTTTQSTDQTDTSQSGSAQQSGSQLP